MGELQGNEPTPILTPAEREALTSMAAIFTQIHRRRINKEARKIQHAHLLVGIRDEGERSA